MKRLVTIFFLCFFSLSCTEPEFVPPAKDTYIFFMPESKRQQDEQEAQNIVIVAEPKQTGGKVTLNVKDMDIREFFQLLSEESGERLGIQNSLDYKITLSAEERPWLDVLWDVIKQHKLTPTFRENPPQVEVFNYIPPGKQLNFKLIFQIAVNLCFVGFVVFFYQMMKRRMMPTLLRGDKEKNRERDWWHGR